MKKRFGIEFKENEKGFTIEFTGDEESIKARKEAVAAWKEFMEKAEKAGFPRPFHQLYKHRHGCCCNTTEDAETSTEQE
ncbi:MAG: hypothetical protein M0Z55_04915 [Peptococcaceae bacterium]|nr:hypothetical protein [Peptococcaceae bacterium]